MYYSLKPEYLLRGWEGMAWVLVRRPENQIMTLSREMFQTLLLCDGETELSASSLDDETLGALREAEEKGFIQPCENPQPLAEDQYYQYYKNRYVSKVFWSVTGRCNFRCRHCYMDAPDGMLGELSTEEAFDLIDQMAECGVLWVDITGGEPLVRKDIWQLIDRILSHHMVIRDFSTNGWLLNDAVLDEFERRGLHPSFAISFDGVGWHDWMRGRKGAEEDALRAMRLCHSRGYQVSVGMCIHRGNVGSLPATVEALRAAGIEYIKTSNVDPTDLWNAHSEGNGMTREEYIQAMLPYIEWYYKSGRPIKQLEFGGMVRMRQDAPGELSVHCYDGTESCLDNYLCGAVRWSCYITPDGRLLPCMPMTASPKQELFPKVQEIGLRQGLSSSYYMQFVNGRIRDLLAANAECAGCDYRYKCGGGCRASALAIDQNPMGCDRQMCMFWKNEYDARIRQAIEDAEAKWGKTEK